MQPIVSITSYFARDPVECRGHLFRKESSWVSTSARSVDRSRDRFITNRTFSFFFFNLFFFKYNFKNI